MKIRALLFAASAALFAWMPAARAQVSLTPASVLYRLDDPSNYQQGCQPPCLCPIQIEEALYGTFSLTFDHSSPNWFDYYRVDDVNWVIAGFGGTDRRVTGRGEYRVGGQLVVQQQLTLDLSVDGAPAQHYDSGLVVGSAFPTIAIAVALNGFFCYDQVYSLVASPVQANEIQRFGLHQSIFEEGCFAPCTCPLAFFRTVGGFGLVSLNPTSTAARQYMAVVDARWTAVLPSGGGPLRTWSGFGIYHIDHAAAQQSLVLDLSERGARPERFHSGLVPLVAPFPRLKIDISMNGFFCFDRAFLLRAAPQ